jgi:hypothetical protein
MGQLIKYSKYVRSLALLILFLIAMGCADLEVENLNNPDTESVLKDSEDILAVAGGLFQTWHNEVQLHGMSIMLSSLADQTTTNWDNAGWRPMVGETRIPWDNDKNYRFSWPTLVLWNNFYKVITLSNDILNRIYDGNVIIDSKGKDVTKMVEAMCYFCSGISHGYVACIFDQGFFMGPATNPSSLEFISYDILMDSSIHYLDRSIEICNNTQFVLPGSWINGRKYSSQELKMISSSYAARFLASNSRNKQQDQSADWLRILDYASSGLNFNLEIYNDDVNWYNTYAWTAYNVGWTMIDLRIIKLMDPDYPRVWPADNVSWNTKDGEHPGPANTLDARHDSLFEYMEIVPLQSGKGYEYFSNYRWKKYDYILANAEKGLLPVFNNSENDLLMAEALVKANDDLTAAIDIINSGTRINNGKLEPLPQGASREEVLDAIFYEKDIELCYSGLGISFFDMRRRDMLQPGTLLHFPVPGQELWILLLDEYTYGGTIGEPGQDYSIGGWY